MLVVSHFLVGKKGDQALLQRAKKPFDFAFGLGGWSHAMIDAKSCQSALELAGGIQAILSGSVAKKA